MTNERSGPTEGRGSAVRLDVWLKVARLWKQRSQAKAACEGGRIRVGGNPAKAAREVKVGDELEVTLPRRRVHIEVCEVPDRPVAKKDAVGLYRVVREERLTDEDDWRE